MDNELIDEIIISDENGNDVRQIRQEIGAAHVQSGSIEHAQAVKAKVDGQIAAGGNIDTHAKRDRIVLSSNERRLENHGKVADLATLDERRYIAPGRARVRAVLNEATIPVR